MDGADGRSRSSEKDLVIRPLALSDYSKGFMDLLRQLALVGEVSSEDFSRRFEEIFRAEGSPSFIAVVEDEEGQIVAAGTLLIEKKFLRQCGSVGHIEDVVVDARMRGHHLGQRIVKFLTDYARDAHCYKVILDCSEDNVGFYEKCGFSRRDAHMAKYFE